MIKVISPFLLIFLICAGAVHSEDLGQNGVVRDLGPDAREQIKNVVKQKERSGELDRYWQNYRDKTIAAIKNPAPLGIASNYAFSSRLYDLRFVMPQDVQDEKGNVLVRRGTVIEPLKTTPLQSGLIFIDGRDQKQIDYAIAQGRKEPLKIVLTAGSPYDLRVRYQNESWLGGNVIPFYFDQKKMIIDQFARLYGVNINRVPAKLTQVGSQLQVQFGMQP